MVLACLRKAGEDLIGEMPRRNFEAESGTVRERRVFEVRIEDMKYIVCGRET